MSSSWEITFISLQVTCVAVQLGPMGLFPAKNLIQLADNNGFENASLAERGTKVKDMRTRVDRFKGYFRIGYSQSNILMPITMLFPMM